MPRCARFGVLNVPDSSVVTQYPLSEPVRLAEDAGASRNGRASVKPSGHLKTGANQFRMDYPDGNQVSLPGRIQRRDTCQRQLAGGVVQGRIPMALMAGHFAEATGSARNGSVDVCDGLSRQRNRRENDQKRQRREAPHCRHEESIGEEQ
jgi:hypothetical protein